MAEYIFKEYGFDRVTIYEMNQETIIKSPVKLQNYHLIMLTEGTIEIDVNYRIFQMTGRSSLHMSAGDIIRKIKASDKVRGYHIVFSDEFHAEIRSTRNSPINLQLKKEYPYQVFTEKEYDFLLQSVSRLTTYIQDTTHFYHALVIKNEVHNLVLNISDKRRKEHGYKIYKADRQKMILERFKDLLNGHCEKKHEVSWYAEALTISADYLSKITKENDGRSARAWINEAIIAKAASLMHYANLNIKEISERLNFTDQSSFGRFIRKNTGMSPKEFREHVTDTDNIPVIS